MIQGRIELSIEIEASDELEYHQLVAELIERVQEYSTVSTFKVERMEPAHD